MKVSVYATSILPNDAPDDPTFTCWEKFRQVIEVYGLWETPIPFSRIFTVVCLIYWYRHAAIGRMRSTGGQTGVVFNRTRYRLQANENCWNISGNLISAELS